MIRAIIGVVALLLIVGGIVGSVYYWDQMKGGSEEVTTVAEGPEVALGDEALDVSEAEIPGDIVPGEDDALLPGDDIDEVVIPIGEEAPVDLSGEDLTLPVPEDTEGTGRALVVEGEREENPVVEAPVTEETSETTTIVEPVAETTTAPEVETTSPPEVESISVEPVPAPTSTPIPTTPVKKSTPAPTVAAGNYQVYTTGPVLEAQVKEIERAMKPLHVTLQKRQVGTQQRQAYRVALGYYRTKEEAKGWARQYLSPRKIQYYIYPVQGMYSIQLGVFAERANVDRKLRELYQQFQGWRLPLRTEITMLNTKSYQLSVRGITENMAKKVQNALYRMRVPAELAGI